MTLTPTVFLVDNDRDFLNATSVLLKSTQAPLVMCESGTEFLATYSEGRPGCLLLDIVMPGMSGLELLEELQRRHWFLPTIAMTAYGNVRDAVQAMKLGAMDYIEKPFQDKNAVVSLVKRALQAATFARQVRTEIQEIGDRISKLTSREREVLDLVVEGRSSKEIASEHKTKLRTVESQRFSIMTKLNAESVPILVRMVLRYKVATQLDPALAASEVFEKASVVEPVAGDSPTSRKAALMKKPASGPTRRSRGNTR